MRVARLMVASALVLGCATTPRATGLLAHASNEGLVFTVYAWDGGLGAGHDDPAPMVAAALYGQSASSLDERGARAQTRFKTSFDAAWGIVSPLGQLEAALPRDAVVWTGALDVQPLALDEAKVPEAERAFAQRRLGEAYADFTDAWGEGCGALTYELARAWQVTERLAVHEWSLRCTAQTGATPPGHALLLVERRGGLRVASFNDAFRCRAVDARLLFGARIEGVPHLVVLRSCDSEYPALGALVALPELEAALR